MKRLLKALLFILVIATSCLGLLVYLPLPSAPNVGIPGNYAISHVSIVDTISGEIARDRTVLIAEGRVSEVLHSSETYPRDRFAQISGMGKFLIPGLWDMHTHSLKLSPQLHHPLFLRWGVTAARDMSGCLGVDDSYWACPADRRRWEKTALAGERVSPRYPLQSSYQTNGGDEVPAGYPDFFRLQSVADAHKLVDFYAGQGVDFIKTYSGLTPTQFDQLSRAASARGIALAGHKPLSASLHQALASQMTSIEHGRLFMFECYSGIEAFRRLEDPVAHYNARFMRELIEGQDAATCQQLMAQMAGSPASWVPTLTTLKMSAMANDPTFREDSRLATVPYVVRKLIWEPDITRAATRGYDDEGRFVHTDFFNLASRQIGLAQRAGVRVLAGTDNIDSWVFTGSSLHDELAMLVNAGLSPLVALQAATIEAARFSGLADEFGSVEPGKRADLVLLSADPLADINNTRQIEAVLFAGRYFDRSALQSLESYATTMAQSVRVNLRYLYTMLASASMRKQLAD